jgi:NAD(P)-dependent dehydrogenase (short-subunit alcohol dehydrogenase family)
MSKAAANAAFQNLSLDLKPAGIAVGIYHPGVVRALCPAMLPLYTDGCITCVTVRQPLPPCMALVLAADCPDVLSATDVCST